MTRQSACLACLAAAAAALPAAAQTAYSIHAQRLLDSTLARHPEVTVMALHVTPPQGRDNIIIASNIGRIGKKADADDMRVLDSGKPLIERTRTGDISVELPLQAAGGQTVGVLGATISAKAAADKDQALAVRDELRAGTGSLDALFEPVR
jgi:iron complex outermembrane receptor protein